MNNRILPLEPRYYARAWGGQRLQQGSEPIGEAWIADGDSLITAGAYQGQTLGAVAAQARADLLGTRVAARYSDRFPLLIKLLDCADWLSVQVHPTDEQAEQLEGAGHYGKTEAWHMLEATPDATLLAGVKAGIPAAQVTRAIEGGKVLDVMEEVPARAGESVFIAAGTLHALGPGILLYEVQQASDITYRVYDWDRPASLGRELHLAQATTVVNPQVVVEAVAAPSLQGTESVSVVACPYFELEVVAVAADAFEGDTQHQSFHILTVIAGQVEVRCGDGQVALGCYETALLAGAAGHYTIRAVEGEARLLRASVPETDNE